jgi:hypothetical protein
MAKINDLDEVERIITLDRNVPAGTYSVARHARIRRWDQTQNVDINGLLTTAAGPIPLEDGIQVRFSGDNFKVGDHWSFAARTAIGDVERLVEAPPQGIKHHYCRLALVRWDIKIDGDDIEIGEPEISDCRPTFPPLTDVEVRDWPTVEEIAWDNDKPMSLPQFNRGLGVRFSEPMKSATATLNTFIVTLELPLELSQQPHRVGGHWPIIVRGTIEVEDDDTVWEFHPQPIDAAILRQWLEVEQGVSRERRIRCRVVLKGNAILTEDGRPLDGNVFGRLRDDGTTDLTFPSGDGYKGGDFESWFYLSREEG